MLALWIVYYWFEAREGTIYFNFIYNNFMLASMSDFDLWRVSPGVTTLSSNLESNQSVLKINPKTGMKYDSVTGKLF